MILCWLFSSPQRSSYNKQRSNNNNNNKQSTMANNNNPATNNPGRVFNPMFAGLEAPTHLEPNNPKTLADIPSLHECDFGLTPSATIDALTPVAGDLLEIDLSDGEETLFEEKEVAAKERETGVDHYEVPLFEKPLTSSPGKTRKDKREIRRKDKDKKIGTRKEK